MNNENLSRNLCKRALLAGLLALTVAVIPVTTAVAADHGPKIRFVGPDEVVISAEAFSCPSIGSLDDGSLAFDTPDAPPRMIRREDGQFELIAADPKNIPFYSKDGKVFRRKNCVSALPSKVDPDPSHFADQDWITGFATSNGRDVYALVHDEYHGAAHMPDCKDRLKRGDRFWAPICLSVNMASFISHDQGTTFAAMPGDLHIAAAVPVKVTTETTSVGIRDSSNVIKSPVDGYYYFMAHAMPSPPQLGGTCLFRSRDPLHEPWLAWDGTGFTSRMGSPYTANKQQMGTCIPVVDNTYYAASISYNTKLKAFIAMGKSSKRYIFAITSKDLIHWSEPTFLRPSVADNWWKPGKGDPDPDSYYSIIDLNSESRTFDTSDESPYLYYVRWRTSRDNVQSHQRDIVRTRLEIGY